MAGALLPVFSADFITISGLLLVHFSAPQIRVWMEKAGMHTWIDGIGNVHGRIEGRSGGPALIMGSHYDTVVDGGK